MSSTPQSGQRSPESKKRSSGNDQIAELEKEIANTKVNKRTEAAVGLLKAKLSNLREKVENKGKGQKKGDGYSVRKSGHATVVLLGFPSVGKSTLLNTLTNAKSNVAAYAFTTLTCIPGTLEYKHAKIQILDVPGIVRGAAAGTGRGKEVLQVIRSADLVLVLLDVFHPEHYEAIMYEVYNTGIRLNQHRPDIRIEKTIRGGIDIGNTVPLKKIDRETTLNVMREMGYVNANVVFREDANADQLIDILRGYCVYLPAVTVINKVDLAAPEHIETFKRMGIPIDLAISAQKREHIEELKEVIFNRLNFIRLYLKEIGKKADLQEPLIMRSPCTIQDLCEKLHRDFVMKFKFARVWGTSVRFEGQKILNLKHVLADNDIIELHMR